MISSVWAYFTAMSFHRLSPPYHFTAKGRGGLAI
jgi:hypothetical protein